MLSGAPCGRTTFLLNGSLRPVDGYYQGGQFFAFNRFTGDVRVTAGPSDPCAVAPAPGAVRDSAGSAARVAAGLLDRAAQLFDTTAAMFLQRDTARDAAGRRRTAGAQ
jgi:hypothetical protein